MNEKEVSTRERIKLATIECLESEGILGITTRQIAKTAGVNIAAINYYFRSKENLLDEVIRSSVDHFVGDLEEILALEELDIYQKVDQILTYLIEGGFRYLGFTKAHLYEAFVHGNYDSPFVKKINPFLDKLARRIQENEDRRDQRELRITLMQSISALILALSMPGLFAEFVKIDFAKDKKSRDLYKKRLFHHIFGERELI